MTKIYLYFPIFQHLLYYIIVLESGITPVENELFTISVDTVVVGSGTISELNSRTLNWSFAQLVLSTVRTLKQSLPGTFQKNFTRGNMRKSRLSWLFEGGLFSNISLIPSTFRKSNH